MSRIIPWAVGVGAAALLGVMGFTYSGSRRPAEGCGSRGGRVSRECREGGCGGRAWRGGRGAPASEAASRKACGDANCGVKACVCGTACACGEKRGCKDCSCEARCEATCGDGKSADACSPACPGRDKCGCSR
jgi:hypothetical protein